MPKKSFWVGMAVKAKNAQNSEIGHSAASRSATRASARAHALPGHLAWVMKDAPFASFALTSPTPDPFDCSKVGRDHRRTPQALWTAVCVQLLHTGSVRTSF